MHLGTVKHYNTAKGYGFIVRDDGKPDVFLHSSDLRASGFTSLDRGDRVQFHTKPARETDRSPVACQIQPFDAGGNLRKGNITTTAGSSRSEGADLMQEVFGR